MLIEREAPWNDPLSVFRPLAGDPGAMLLHGGDLAAGGEPISDWSFIVHRPAMVIEVVNGALVIDGARAAEAPFDFLQATHAARRRPALPGCRAPLTSGMVGFIGYECGELLEPSVRGPKSPFGLPDMSFGVYDAVMAFDRARRRAYILGRTEDAVERVGSDMRSVGAGPSFPAHVSRVRSTRSAPAYQADISDVIERIRDGELFQANISQRITASLDEAESCYDLFCAGSRRSSAPFGAFLRIGRAEILSFSPERFFRIERSVDDARRFIIRAEPIKGTRPRGQSGEEDRRLLLDLQTDAKERAENIMIADLTRNDLSRICDDATVVENDICAVVSHNSVHHMVSRISGRLRDGLGALDALEAMFPCGSITGAPKVQAMKVIAEIEGSGRGPYCGAIGYIDDGGEADFSVAIRTAVTERRPAGVEISFAAGGGVTLKSNPQAEYAESLAKARFFFDLLNIEPAAIA